ncbi:MAG: dihydroorotate dehydrogenase electron transfer subunit [Clostridia bacterium]|jgi:dihydroorotate dehydrogenase electron transfer subunit|nr:dihydroorotate dehydrogenase electron transfer subunit [Clostridia bacterium]
MKVNINAKLIKKEQLKNDIYKFSVQAPEIVKQAKPGNFIEIRVQDQVQPFLRRPISIYNMEKEKGILEFIFQEKGIGTQILSKREVGEEIDIIGPLGYGTFGIKEYKNVSIIGGGIGVFPLYELAKNLKSQTKSHINIYLGYRNKDCVILEEEFKKVSDKLNITTDDGSYGTKGFAIDLLKEDIKNQEIDSILACGPLPMLRAVKELAKQCNIECQVSLEEKMACGLGACLGCAVKTSRSSKESPEYWHVCKAGPVFNAFDVDF